MRITAELTNAGEQSGRRSRRAKVHTAANYRDGWSRGAVELVDLSPTGARIESHLNLKADSLIWLKLPGLEAWQARIAWVDRHVAGCEFLHALHPAVFERVVALCRANQPV